MVWNSLMKRNETRMGNITKKSNINLLDNTVDGEKRNEKIEGNREQEEKRLQKDLKQ